LHATVHKVASTAETTLHLIDDGVEDGIGGIIEEKVDGRAMTFEGAEKGVARTVGIFPDETFFGADLPAFTRRSPFGEPILAGTFRDAHGDREAFPDIRTSVPRMMQSAEKLKIEKG